jgi:hypothetical protein
VLSKRLMVIYSDRPQYEDFMNACFVRDGELSTGPAREMRQGRGTRSMGE